MEAEHCLIRRDAFISTGSNELNVFSSDRGIVKQCLNLDGDKPDLQEGHYPADGKQRET